MCFDNLTVRANPELIKASTDLVMVAQARFRTFLLVTFAAVALLLAIAGVYGVMAYTVSRRMPELGVRVALGASPENIMRLVLGQGAKLAAAGLAVGIALAFLGGRLLQGLLFGVTPRDPEFGFTAGFTWVFNAFKVP